MTLSDINTGDIINNHKVVAIYTKTAETYDKKYQTKRIFDQTNITVKCLKCEKVRDILPSGLPKLGCSTYTCSKRFKDLTGKIFGDLTVIEYDEEKSKPRRRRWNCKCNRCDSTTSIPTATLIYLGKTECNECARKTVGLLHKLPDHRAMFNRGISNLRSSALRKGREVTLSDEDIITLFKTPCAYCGSPCEELVDTINRNGIDRVDNDLGYIKDNVVPCCEICNRMKLTLTREDFLKHIDKIHTHNK